MEHPDKAAMRLLNDGELSLVSGGTDMVTTLALGEEDGGWCGGGVVTTLAVGEEEPFSFLRNLPLDINIHIGASGWDLQI